MKMLDLDLSACHVELERAEVKAKIEAMQAREKPDFTKYAPNLKRLEKTLREIARIIEGEIIGDDAVTIKGICGIKEAQKGILHLLPIQNMHRF